MNLFAWIAAVIFFLQLPNPLFWLVVHPLARFWRGRIRAAYVTAVSVAWSAVTGLLITFHSKIFRGEGPSKTEIGIGLLLIAFDLWLFGKVHRDLGTSRLIGKTELSGGGEVARTGIYSYMRHPRYAGMIASVAGACLLAATRLMWAIAGVWLLLVATVIALEERELRVRFGPAYEEYCQRVPRFLPYRLLTRTK
ncbi:MAG TPA: isoprenylcysteine carboxylmethyltransferase family protein [Candidatus Acidoferrales bacterium]|nr:isoprenylcysteine carboxylmethyltransferase family protein [Candidatus Acidoferrales bacterium]